jgi:hypothetical protein
MGETVRELLEKFEALEPADRQEAAAEILRRAMGKDDVSDKGYEELGAAILGMYDAEEGESAKN